MGRVRYTTTMGFYIFRLEGDSLWRRPQRLSRKGRSRPRPSREEASGAYRRGRLRIRDAMGALHRDLGHCGLRHQGGALELRPIASLCTDVNSFKKSPPNGRECSHACRGSSSLQNSPPMVGNPRHGFAAD